MLGGNKREYGIKSVNPFPIFEVSSKRTCWIDLVVLSKTNSNSILIVNYILDKVDNSKHNYISLSNEELNVYFRSIFPDDTKKAIEGKVFRGIISLLEASVIAKGVEKNWYWINRNVI